MPGAKTTRQGSGFFFMMSVLLLAIVVVGFAPTFFLRPFSEARALPLCLVIHGTALTAWFVWFVVQTAAIRVGRPALHRRLGPIGVGIGAACVIAGPLATLGAVSSLRALGLDWDTDMATYPALGIEGVSMQLYAKMLVFGNFGSIAVFAGLLVAAVLLRSVAAAHKRLMLFASLSLITPALARVSRWPGFGGEDSVFIPLVVLVLLLSIVVYDRAKLGRVHRATWVGLLANVLVPLGFLGIAVTPLGTGVIYALE